MINSLWLKVDNVIEIWQNISYKTIKASLKSKARRYNVKIRIVPSLELEAIVNNVNC